MRLVYNSNSTMYLPALMQIRVARETGWDGVFVRAEHLRRYLAQDYPVATPARGPRGPRAGQHGRAARRRALAAGRAGGDARARRRRSPELAVDVGVSNVQLLSGPVAPGGAYSGPASCRRPTSAGSRPRPSGRSPTSGRRTGSATTSSRSRGRRSGTLARAVEVIDAAERDNVGLVLDFWHLWQRGTTPDDVARLDRRRHLGRRLRAIRSVRPARPRRISARAASGRARARSRSASGWPLSSRPASTAGGTTSSTARSTGSGRIPFAVGAGLLDSPPESLQERPRSGRLTPRTPRCYGLRNRLQSDGGCGPGASFPARPPGSRRRLVGRPALPSGRIGGSGTPARHSRNNGPG